VLKIHTCHIKRAFYKVIVVPTFVKLRLVRAYCLPVLRPIYCIGALNLPVAKIKDLGVCWNDCFRKLFGCKRFKSVKEVQYFCGEYRLIWFMSYSDGSFWVLQISFVTDFPVCITRGAIMHVSELKLKFGDTDSVGGMKQLVHVYFGHPVWITCSFELFVYLYLYSLVLSVRLSGTVSFFLFLLVIILYLYLCSTWVANKHLIILPPEVRLSYLTPSYTHFHPTYAHRTLVANSSDPSWKLICSDKPTTLHDSSENSLLKSETL